MGAGIGFDKLILLSASSYAVLAFMPRHTCVMVRRHSQGLLSPPLATMTLRSLVHSTALAMALLAAPLVAQADGGTPVDLKFASFFKQPIGPRGLEIAEALRAADGKRVRLVGYMVAQEEPAAGRFMLTPRPVRMSEHADGDADDLPPATVTVLLDAEQRDRIVAHQSGLLALTGRLTLGREEDSAGRVSWVRLQLDPEALAADRLSAAPAASHAH